MSEKLYNRDELTLILNEYHNSLFVLPLTDEQLNRIVDYLIKQIYTK